MRQKKGAPEGVPKYRSFESVLYIVGSFGGLLGLILPIFLGYTAYKSISQDEQLILYTIYALVFLSIIFGSLFALFNWRFQQREADFANYQFTLDQLKNAQQERDGIADIINNTSYEAKNQVTKFLMLSRQLQRNEKITKEGIQSITRNFFMFNVALLSNIKDLFDKLTDGNCGISIKFTDSDQPIDDPSEMLSKYFVIPFMRDPISYRRRHQTDAEIPRFGAQSNTAFLEILNPNLPNSHFVCDDLSSLSKYVNLNPRWRDQYNSTLVVPIRFEIGQRRTKDNSRVIQKHDTLGFLCIDNMGGGLNNRRCIDYAHALADSYYIVISSFAYFAFDYAKSERKGTEAISLDETDLSALWGPSAPAYVHYMLYALERMVKHIALLDEQHQTVREPEARSKEQ